MQSILSLCENRRVLFDNKTKDEKKQSEQVRELLSFVKLIAAKNHGLPYTNELFTKLKVEILQI